MQTVSSEWKKAQADKLVPISYVEISYKVSDPAAVEKATASDNGHLLNASASSIVGAAGDDYQRYSCLEPNAWVLDGKTKTPDASGAQKQGYISSQMSARQGQTAPFSDHPIITVAFSEPIKNIMPGITLQWSTAYGEFAVGYVLSVYSGDEMVFSADVSDNKDVINRFDVMLDTYDTIILEIKEWSLPDRHARVEGITVGTVMVFDKTTIMEYEHTQSADMLSLTLPKSEISFSISNLDGEWNPDNPQGVYKYLIERQEITVKYGYKINGAVEWIPCGKFYMSEWNTPQNGIVASFTARDVLGFADCPFTVPNERSMSLYELCEIAMAEAGLTEANVIVDGSLSNYTVTIPEDFDYTCAEVMQLSANAACCIMRIDRSGALHIEKLNEALTDYSINRFNSYKNAEYEISKPLMQVDVNDGLAVQGASQSGEVQKLSNPLMSSAQNALAVAQWAAGILSCRRTLNGEYRADPRLDALDLVTVENKYATQTVAVTEVKYTFSGAFKGYYEGRAI